VAVAVNMAVVAMDSAGAPSRRPAFDSDLPESNPTRNSKEFEGTEFPTLCDPPVAKRLCVKACLTFNMANLTAAKLAYNSIPRSKRLQA